MRAAMKARTADGHCEELAKRASDKGIKTVVMDRGGYYYTGRIKSLAEGARKGGLEF